MDLLIQTICNWFNWRNDGFFLFILGLAFLKAWDSIKKGSHLARYMTLTNLLRALTDDIRSSFPMYTKTWYRGNGGTLPVSLHWRYSTFGTTGGMLLPNQTTCVVQGRWLCITMQPHCDHWYCYTAGNYPGAHPLLVINACTIASRGHSSSSYCCNNLWQNT